jgi:hypothetical protein
MAAESIAEEAGHSDEPPKKRAAERQITKDDGPGGSDDEEETAPGTGFPKADEATLKARRILKVRHPTAPPPFVSFEKTRDDETEHQQQSNRINPFASISLSTGSVFGAGFRGGFGGASNKPGTGFGFAGSVGFGSAPGSSSTVSVFGSSTAFSGGLTSTASSESAFGATSSKPEPPSVVLPEEVELRNGEEEEECVIECRAKSHILVDVEEIKASEPERPSGPSVPPSSSTAPVARPSSDAGEAEDEVESAADESRAEDKNESKEKDATSSGKGGEALNDKQESKEAAQTQCDEKKRQQDWRELGIGPLRILKKDNCHTRVVQRRETQPGGPGTKLIINVSLPKECTVALQGEKYVRLTTIEPSGKAAIFLLKVKTAKEAQELREVLEKEIDKAASFVGK